MDATSIRRAYASLSPMYDILFNKVFHAGRVSAIRLMQIQPGERILETGVGTGLSLPLYPEDCSVTGIDLSEHMLDRARLRVLELDERRFKLQLMDCSDLQFEDSSFDHVMAAYVISVVQDPVRSLKEMRRVCRPGGYLIILNHFRSENPMIGAVEDLVSPLCSRIGFHTDVKMDPLLKDAGLIADRVEKVNLFHGWRLIRCVNPDSLTCRVALPPPKEQKGALTGNTVNRSTSTSPIDPISDECI